MLTSINKVSVDMGISSRTLRYWETAGLFKSSRDAQSGWRVYDDAAMQRIRITELLRRLDLPVNDIKNVLDNKTISSLCQVLRKRLTALTDECSDLEILKTTINEIIEVIEAEPVLTLPMLENISLPVVLTRKKHDIKKSQGGFSMENLKNKYAEVKIVKMAPARAVAFSYVGVEPEDKHTA